MPTFAGPFEPRQFSTPRLLSILWRAEAELAHLIRVGCPACGAIPAFLAQARYEREKAISGLTSRGLDAKTINEVSDLGFRAAIEHREMHEFPLRLITPETKGPNR